MFWYFGPWGMWDLNCLTRDWTLTLYIGRRSLSHRITRDIPNTDIIFFFHWFFWRFLECRKRVCKRRGQGEAGSCGLRALSALLASSQSQPARSSSTPRFRLVSAWHLPEFPVSSTQLSFLLCTCLVCAITSNCTWSTALERESCLVYKASNFPVGKYAP